MHFLGEWNGDPIGVDNNGYFLLRDDESVRIDLKRIPLRILYKAANGFVAAQLHDTTSQYIIPTTTRIHYERAHLYSFNSSIALVQLISGEFVPVRHKWPLISGWSRIYQITRRIRTAPPLTVSARVYQSSSPDEINKPYTIRFVRTERDPAAYTDILAQLPVLTQKKVELLIDDGIDSGQLVEIIPGYGYRLLVYA